MRHAKDVIPPITLGELAVLIAYAEIGHECECGKDCPFHRKIEMLKDWLVTHHPHVLQEMMGPFSAN